MTTWPAPESDDWYWCEERAGILEYDGGMIRPDAEARALEEKAQEDYDSVFSEEVKK
jgi:hypothetical protein